MAHNVFKATETEKKIFEKLKEIVQIAKEENPNLEYLTLAYVNNSHIMKNEDYAADEDFAGRDFYTFNNSYWEEDSADYPYPINFSTHLSEV